MGAQQSRGADSKSTRGEPSSKAGKTPSQQLADNKNLSTNLGKLLPAGTNLQAASSGFKNLGQFVAAVHVSNNLGIPFADLKARMVDGDSLGSAIQSLRPAADANAEARKAERQANRDIARTR